MMGGSEKKEKESSKKTPPHKSATRPTQALETKPSSEMVIDGKRHDETVKTSLKLKNVSGQRASYKIVCNHPFVIKTDPSSGFIDAGATVSVTVKRLEFDAEKYDSQGRRTALLIQHVTCSDKATDVQKLWAHMIDGKSMKKRLPIKLTGSDKRVLGESEASED